MQTTTFKLVVDEAPIAVPDTGYNIIGSSSASGDKQMVLAIFAIVGVVLATLLIVAILRYRKKAKFGFNIKASKGTMIFRSLLAVAALGGLGFGANFLYNVMAAQGATFTTKGEITADAVLKKEESVIVCAADEVKISQALPGGYRVKMRATPLTLTEATTAEDEENDNEENGANGEAIVIPSFTTTGGFAENTWGVVVDNEEDVQGIYPESGTTSHTYKLTETASEEGETTIFKYCVNLGADAKPGTYAATISYELDATEVSYTLHYDLNGGHLLNEMEDDKSDNTIAADYTFTIADATPIPDDPEATFYGWSVTGDSTSDIYNAGDEITVTDINTTLKAVYGYGLYTLTYSQGFPSFVANCIDDATGETIPGCVPHPDDVENIPEPQKCILMEKTATSCQVRITRQTPRRTGYTFLGWGDEEFAPDHEPTLDETKAAATHPVGTVVEMTANKIIHAIWWDLDKNPDYQMELTWDENPSDLDTHLAIVKGHSLVEEVTWDHKKATLGEGTIELDVDDRNGYGPETLTLNGLTEEQLHEYVFYYYVRLFDGEGTLKSSDAKIVIILKDGTTKEYDVSTSTVVNQSGEYWNVFAIKDGEIVERNTITADRDLTY